MTDSDPTCWNQPLAGAGAEARIGLGRRLVRISAGERLGSVWVTAAVLFILFSGFRVALLAFTHGQLKDTPAAEMARCLLVGLRYDATAVGYMILPMALALSLAPGELLVRRGFARAVLAYAAFLVSVVFLTNTIGAVFFARFGRRLNYMAYAYLAHRETLEFLWSNYPTWAVLPGMAAWFYVWYRLFRRRFIWRGRQAWPLRWRIASAVVLAGLCLLAGRGTLQRRALRGGPAFFSLSGLIDELTMNDFFTMFVAAKSELGDSLDEARDYGLPKMAQAAEVARGMFFQDGDEPLSHPANPLWRRSTSPLPPRDLNVVVIIMESMASPAVGLLGYDLPSSTPCLDALAGEGLVFERMYACGARTSRAVVGVLCGHPDLAGRTVMKRPQAQGRFLSLPEVLRRRGYRTMFLYGGRAEFDNMGPFLAAAGIDEIIDQDRMPGKPGNWGVPDECIFQAAHEKLLEMGPQPFFAAILTVSNHDPYQVPAGRVEMLPATADPRNAAVNACRYADWALGEFLREARRSAYFRNTVFVLVADHGAELDINRLLDVPGSRIPCIFYAPGLIAPGRIATVAGQTDLPPTILGLLGGQYDHCFFGRDVLRVPPDHGFALLHEGGRLAFVRGDYALTLVPGPKTTLFRLGLTAMHPQPANPTHDRLAETMARELRACYKTAVDVFEKGAHCDPQRYAASAPAAERRRDGGSDD